MTTAGGPSTRLWPVVVARGPGVLLALLPGAVTVFVAFQGGGFSVAATAGATALLLALLAVRVMTVPRPAEGVNPSMALAVVALVLLALWALLSSRWSGAPARALIDFDRTLLYALTLAAFGAVGMEPRRLRWMVRGLALAALVVCGAGLISRLLPGVWPIDPSALSPRLSYPVSYQNALGLLAAIGITLCVGLTCNERESRLVRVLAAAATPVLASTLVLTLSRGGFATAALGVLVFAAVGHPRALLAGLLAAGPATAIAIASTYGAELLVSGDALASAARDQGRHVAAVVALCALGAGLVRALGLYVDDALGALRPSPQLRRRLLAGAAVVLAVGVVAGAVAVDAPEKYDSFVSGVPNAPPAAPGTPLAGARLTSVTDNGRIAYWTVALDEFERDVLRGAGAGTYSNSWSTHRPQPVGDPPRPVALRDAHSLYAEILGELGIVGLALLLTALLTILVGVARRTHGTDRALYATVLAALVAWAVAAGFDWHWEMPVATMWVFALGGAAIAGARDRTPATRFLGMLPRTVIAIACCALLALVPLRLLISDVRLQSARDAFIEGRCDEVSLFARQSLDAFGSRTEPRELSAGCDLLAGRAWEAIPTLRAAVRRDPDNWRVHYALAAVQARAGIDPRAQIRLARSLNPFEPLVMQVAPVLERADERSDWRKAARDLKLGVLTPPI